jgi:hypothetical protein
VYVKIRQHPAMNRVMDALSQVHAASTASYDTTSRGHDGSLRALADDSACS